MISDFPMGIIHLKRLRSHSSASHVVQRMPSTLETSRFFKDDTQHELPGNCWECSTFVDLALDFIFVERLLQVHTTFLAVIGRLVLDKSWTIIEVMNVKQLRPQREFLPQQARGEESSAFLRADAPQRRAVYGDQCTIGAESCAAAHVRRSFLRFAQPYPKSRATPPE